MVRGAAVILIGLTFIPLWHKALIWLGSPEISLLHQHLSGSESSALFQFGHKFLFVFLAHLCTNAVTASLRSEGWASLRVAILREVPLQIARMQQSKWTRAAVRTNTASRTRRSVPRTGPRRSALRDQSSVRRGSNNSTLTYPPLPHEHRTRT